MSTIAPTRFSALSTTFAQIDSAAGVIRGVSVITEGPAIGHGLEVDSTTLRQVMECAKEYRGGLKVKMTHAGDAGDIVGFLTDFRIDGPKLLADLHLLENSSHRDYILELAAKIPDTFGLSISFSGPVEDVDGKAFARCSEIFSADVVSEPAANPSGLFEVGTKDNGQTAQAVAPATQPNPTNLNSMNEEVIKKMIEEALFAAMSPVSDRLSKLESAMTPGNPEEKKKEEMGAVVAQAAELAAQNALKAFAAQFGAAPVAPSVSKDVEPAKTEKKFEEIVRDHPDYKTNRKGAIAFCIKNHPTEYAAYNKRVYSGEVIMF